MVCGFGHAARLAGCSGTLRHALLARREFPLALSTSSDAPQAHELGASKSFGRAVPAPAVRTLEELSHTRSPRGTCARPNYKRLRYHRLMKHSLRRRAPALPQPFCIATPEGVRGVRGARGRWSSICRVNASARFAACSCSLPAFTESPPPPFPFHKEMVWMDGWMDGQAAAKIVWRQQILGHTTALALGSRQRVNSIYSLPMSATQSVSASRA